MPTYVYGCESHGRFERILRLAEHRSSFECPVCTVLVPQVLTKPMVIFDVAPWESFESPATGKQITSKREHREDLAESGCRLFEPGEHEENKRNIARRDAETEKLIDETVERAIDQVVASGQPMTIDRED